MNDSPRSKTGWLGFRLKHRCHLDWESDIGAERLRNFAPLCIHGRYSSVCFEGISVELTRREGRLVERELEDPLAHHVRDPVPNAIGTRRAIGQGFEATPLIKIVPP